MADIVLSQGFALESCLTCGIAFAFPQAYKNQRLNDHAVYYCPNGHQQYYIGKSRAELAEEALAIERQRVERITKEKTLLETRIMNGVCPCCNRSFANLQRHMKTKHPEKAKQLNPPRIVKRIA